MAEKFADRRNICQSAKHLPFPESLATKCDISFPYSPHRESPLSTLGSLFPRESSGEKMKKSDRAPHPRPYENARFSYGPGRHMDPDGLWVHMKTHSFRMDPVGWLRRNSSENTAEMSLPFLSCGQQSQLPAKASRGHYALAAAPEGPAHPCRRCQQAPAAAPRFPHATRSSTLGQHLGAPWGHQSPVCDMQRMPVLRELLISTYDDHNRDAPAVYTSM